jgi:hypothetical protein
VYHEHRREWICACVSIIPGTLTAPHEVAVQRGSFDARPSRGWAPECWTCPLDRKFLSLAALRLMVGYALMVVAGFSECVNVTPGHYFTEMGSFSLCCIFGLG